MCDILWVLQIRGHNVATLDPLGISDVDLDSEVPSELIPNTYGLGRYAGVIVVYIC